MKQTTADRGRNLDSKFSARQSTYDRHDGLMKALKAGQDGDRHWDLVQRTADTIQEWAFWRWLGRRSHFIPWEAYQGIIVRADGLIMDAGALTIVAAFERQGKPWVGMSTPSPAEWIRFMAFVLGEVKTRNVLKGGTLSHA